MRQVRWENSALKDAERLDRKTRERIFAAVERVAETGLGDTRAVKERPGEIAIRVGDWRVFYAEAIESIEGQPVRVLRVLRVRSRGHAYGR